MNGWQERYWLVRRGRRGPVPGERPVEDFVCCEGRVGEDTAMALEVFTSWERAEAELRGMEGWRRARITRVPKQASGAVYLR